MNAVLASLEQTHRKTLSKHQLLDALETEFEQLKRTFDPYDSMSPETGYLTMPGLLLPDQKELALDGGGFMLTRYFPVRRLFRRTKDY